VIRYGVDANVHLSAYTVTDDTGCQVRYGGHMLILTRRVGETLMIGDQVSVTVLGVKGNQVRIGVNAPREVAVHREEIFQRIQGEASLHDEKENGGVKSTFTASQNPQGDDD